MHNKQIRCDQCNAEAWVTVATEEMAVLNFCAHDFAKNEVALLAKGWAVMNDERETLTNAKPVSANV